MSKEPQSAASLANNLPRLYGFRFLRDFLLIMPAIVPVYRSCGLDATRILLVQAVFSAASLVFEVPSGYFADVMGRRRGLLTGAVLMALGMTAYGVANRFWWFALAEIILAAGYSLFSGTESALLFDSLASTEQDSRYRKLEGRAEALTRLGTATAAILGGVLAGLSLRLPFWANAGTAWLMFIIAFGLVEPPREKLAGKTPFRDILRIFRESVRDRDLLPSMVLSSALFVTGVIGIWGYFLRLAGAGVSVLSYGVYFAFFQAASALGAASSDRLARALGVRGSYGLLALVPATLILFTITSSSWPVLLTPLAALAWGFSTPLILNTLNRRIESDRRATVLSVSAMLGRVLFVLLSPVFGLLSDHLSDRAGFMFLAVLFVLLAGLAWALSLRRRVVSSA
jgi:MFS family permease